MSLKRYKMTTLVLLAFFSAVGSSILGLADAQEVYNITPEIDKYEKGTLIKSNNFVAIYLPHKDGSIFERRFEGETLAGRFTGVWRADGGKGDIRLTITVDSWNSWGLLQFLGGFPMTMTFTLD